jgi:hypothetical protein
MWLCTLDIEAHQACCPALAGIIQNRQNADYEHRHGEDDQYGGFHCNLATAGLPNTYRSRFFVVQNEPAVNSVYSPRKLRIGPSKGNRTQYQNDNKYKGQQQANRSCNRALVTHSAYLGPRKGAHPD